VAEALNQYDCRLRNATVLVETAMAIRHKVLLLCVLCGVLFWVIDATLDTLFFHQGSFLDMLIFSVHPHDVCLRLAALVIIMASGAAISRQAERRAQAEAALHESQAIRAAERSYGGIFNASNEMIFIHDAATGAIEDVNAAVLETFGYTREEMDGFTVGDLSGSEHPFTQEEADRLIRQAAEEGIVAFEWRSRKKNGELIWTDNTLKPAVVGGRAVILCVARDITDRKQADRALRESESRLRQMADTIEDVFWITDWAEHRTIFASQAYERVWGRSLDDLYANRSAWADAIHPDDRQHAWDRFMRLAGDEAYDEEYRVVRPDGSVRWVRDRGFPIHDSAGQVYRVVGIAQDITERKNAEDELARHRDHLEELVDQGTQELAESQEALRRAERLASIGTLAAGIAHEINNPVGSILLAAQHAQVARGDADKVDKAVASIVDDARRCGNIVGNILTFASQAASVKALHDLNEIVRQAVKFTRKHVEDSGCTLELELDANMPQTEVDEAEIQQVILNLVHNAVQADAKRIILRTTADKDGVRLAVQDDGCGVSEKQRKHFFDPFYTTRQSRGGTGLGLSIVHGIVQDHHGSIDVASRPGRGTTMTVCLPLSTPQDADKPD